MVRRAFFLFTCFSLPFGLLAQPFGFTKLESSSGLTLSGHARGVSFADYDKDGLLDVFIAQTQTGNRLFRNSGDLKFVEVSGQAGLGEPFPNHRTGVWADFDNDGFPDLFVANTSEYRIYRNAQNGQFEDVTAQVGVVSSNQVHAAIWGDVDNDAFVDLYTANFNARNMLFSNKNGIFEDGAGASGINDPSNLAMGGAFGDYDNDGDLDLYLVHDGNDSFRLFQNAGYGYFTDVSSQAGVNLEAQGMGTLFADFDNDGWLDIYITNLDSNALFFNNRDGSFTNTTAASGVGDIGMGWGTLALDYDNDADLDIFVANGSNFHNPPLDNVLYRNNGKRQFENVTAGSGLSSLYDGWCAASGDLNNDGAPDIVLTNWNGDFVEVFINNGGENNFLKISLEGVTCNRYAIGARVRIVAEGVEQIRELSGGSGFLSQNSPVLHFGLGQAGIVDTLEIFWPGGAYEKHLAVQANALIHYIERQPTSASEAETNLPKSMILHQNYPNPFHPGDSNFQPGTRIVFELQEPENLELAVYDLRGRRIQSLARGRFIAGEHRFSWNGNDSFHRPVPAGVYFIKLRAGARVMIRKAVILK